VEDNIFLTQKAFKFDNFSIASFKKEMNKSLSPRTRNEIKQFKERKTLSMTWSEVIVFV